jgi:hypothetical protein
MADIELRRRTMFRGPFGYRRFYGPRYAWGPMWWGPGYHRHGCGCGGCGCLWLMLMVFALLVLLPLVRIL